MPPPPPATVNSAVVGGAERKTERRKGCSFSSARLFRATSRTAELTAEGSLVRGLAPRDVHGGEKKFNDRGDNDNGMPGDRRRVSRDFRTKKEERGKR